jgi:hypothetical protein
LVEESVFLTVYKNVLFGAERCNVLTEMKNRRLIGRILFLFEISEGGQQSSNETVLDQMPKEFHSTFMEATDETISELLGTSVLNALYATLAKNHDITREELPYRLDTAYSVLETVFGVKGARTIGRSIIRRFYTKLNVEFKEDHDHPLEVYLKIAQRELAQR